MSLASEFLDQLFVTQVSENKKTDIIQNDKPIEPKELKEITIQDTEPKELKEIIIQDTELKKITTQNTKLNDNILNEIPFIHGNTVTILKGQHISKNAKVKKEVSQTNYTIETDLEELFPPHFFINAKLGDTVKIKNYFGRITNIQPPIFSILVDVKELDKPLEIKESAHNVIRFLFFKDKAVEQNKENFINIYKKHLNERVENAKSEDEKQTYSFVLKYFTKKMYPRGNQNHVNVLLHERQKLEYELEKESSIRAAVYQDLITKDNVQYFEASVLDAPYNEVKTVDQIMGFVAYRMKNFGTFKSLKQIKISPDQIISEKYIISTEESPYFTFYGSLGNFTPLLYITQSIVNVTVPESFFKFKENDLVELIEGDLKGKSGKIIKKQSPYSILELENGEIVNIDNEDLFFHDIKTNNGIAQVQKIFDDNQFHVTYFGENEIEVINEQDIRHYFTGFEILDEKFKQTEQNNDYIFVHEPQEIDEENFFEQEMFGELIESDQLDHPELKFSYKDKDRLFRMDEILTATQRTHKENIQKIMNVIGVNDSYINLQQTIKDSDEIQIIIRNKLESLKLDRLFRPTDMKLIYIVLIYKQLLLNLQPIRSIIPDFSLSYMIHILFTKASGKITTKTGKSTYLTSNDINSSTIWLNYKWFKFSTPIKVLQELYNTEKYEDMYQLLILNAVEFISDLLNIVINLNPVSKKWIVIEEPSLPSVVVPEESIISDSNVEEYTLEETRKENIRIKLIEIMKKTLNDKLTKAKSDLNQKGIEFALQNINHINYTMNDMMKNKEDYINKYGEIQYYINLKNLEKIHDVFQKSFIKYSI